MMNLWQTDKKYKCLHCETPYEENQSEPCCECGGLVDEIQQDELWRDEPFFYNGYIVWKTYDGSEQTVEYIFYLGNKVVERIKLDWMTIRRFVPQAYSVMPFIWDLFCVAQGDKETTIIKEQNDKNPAEFQVRLHPNPEDTKYKVSLNGRDCMLAKRGETSYSVDGVTTRELTW